MKTGMTMSRLAVMAGLCLGGAFGVLATPPVTSGLKFWVDASDASSVTTNASGLVSQWNDLSGTGNHVTQATDSQKPLYNRTGLDGKPSLSFNSSNVLVRSAGLCYSNHTVFLVAKATAFSENDMLGSGGTAAGDTLIMHYKVGVNTVFRGHYWNASGTAITKDSAINTTVSVPLVYEQRLTDTALELFRNGVRDFIMPFSGSFSANKKSVVLGCRTAGGTNGKCFAGELSEVLIYERALSDAERAQVEAYLGSKWTVSYDTVQATPVTTGLKFRVDASARQSILTNADGTVCQWRDLSGNGYHLQQRSVVSNQPSYNPAGYCGKPALSFNGTNVLVTTASTINYSNHTVFVVAKATDTTATAGQGNDLLGANANLATANSVLLNHFNFRYWGTYWPTNNASSIVIASTAAITFAPTLYELRLDDVGMELFRNGMSDGSTPVGARTNILNGVSLGYRTEGIIYDYGFIGQVAEVLVYDRALSAVERVQVESHLTNKWYTAAAASVPVTRNLKFWVDASVTSSIVTAAGKVVRWKGQSETGYYVKQDSATMQPTYNPQGIKWHPSLSFNGTNVMSIPFTAINYSNHTVFVVAQATEVVAASDFLSGGAAGGGSAGETLLMNYQNKFRGHYMPSTTPASWTTLDSTSAAVVKPVIYEQRLDNANLKIYRNGQLDGTSAAITFYTNVLRTVCLGSRSTGGGNNFKGEMSEVLVYDCALTDAERQQVEAYLYAKWLMERRGTQFRVQ